MTIIKSILEQLENASHPVGKILRKGNEFKVLVIGFKAGMELKEHQSKLPAQLTVLKGQVIYRTGETQIQLNQYDELEIPINVLHAVEAEKDSLCLLIQG